MNQLQQLSEFKIEQHCSIHSHMESHIFLPQINPLLFFLQQTMSQQTIYDSKQINYQDSILQQQQLQQQDFISYQTHKAPNQLNNWQKYRLSRQKRNIKKIQFNRYTNITQFTLSIIKQFKSFIKIISVRRSNFQTLYYWKLGNIKMWMTLHEALSQSFSIYQSQKNKYTNAIKKFFVNYSLPKFNQSDTTKKHSIKKETPTSLSNETLPFLKQLKLIFKDVLVKKYVQFQKDKALNFQVSKTKNEIVIQETKSYSSDSQSEYIPEAYELSRLLEDLLIEKSLIQSQGEYKPELVSKTVFFEPKRAHNSSLKKQKSKIQISQIQPKCIFEKSNTLLDSQDSQNLNKFSNCINYIGEVDNLLSKLTNKSQTLSCQSGLGLRSHQKVSQITQEMYQQSLLSSSLPSKQQFQTSLELSKK